MSKLALDREEGIRLYEDILTKSASVPIGFRYDGKQYAGLGEIKEINRIETNEGGYRKSTCAYAVDEALTLTLHVSLCEEFGECEYYSTFENRSDKPSGVLSDIRAADISFAGNKPVLRSCMGDHEQFYHAYQNDLTQGDSYFASTSGRATHVVFPYFDLVHGDGGTMIALGWAGSWNALFTYGGGSTRLTAQTCTKLNTVLLPGESIRTGLIVLLSYRGRDYDNATNLWREWFMKYNLPKADASGADLMPFSTTCFAGDTGLPNSDGSISERFFTWKPTLDRLVKEQVVPDFRWFDAGWYTDPAGNSVEKDWFGTVGSWELDRKKWPGDSFRKSNDACHKAGMKVFTWFEPERVTHVDDLVKNYGYKKEWCKDFGSVASSFLGDPDCLKWTLGRITKMMGEHGVDMYREDNNIDPSFLWDSFDKAEAEKTGLPRKGITENKSICGHYALWDGIIDFCRNNGKCTFVDSCASGGGRNDIESMRRGVPVMRSDYDRTTTAMRLSQTTSFCRWIPFHGSAVKDTVGQLDTDMGRGSDEYTSRASLLPVYNLYESYNHNPNLDYDLMRRNIAEWKSVNGLLTKDLYVLTPWRYSGVTDKWTALAYADEEKGDAILLAFRQENAMEDHYTARLPFAKNGKTYTLTDADTGKEIVMDGEVLRESGYGIFLPRTRMSVLIRIKSKE